MKPEIRRAERDIGADTYNEADEEGEGEVLPARRKTCIEKRRERDEAHNARRGKPARGRDQGLGEGGRGKREGSENGRRATAIWQRLL